MERLALDLPRFMAQTGKEKALTLLRIIGKEEEVKRLDDQEQQLYNRRHALGQIADQKMKYAQEMQAFPGVPESPVSAGELIERQQAILLRNAENQKKRDNVALLVQQHGILVQKIESLSAQITALIQQKKEAEGAFCRPARKKGAKMPAGVSPAGKKRKMRLLYSVTKISSASSTAPLPSSTATTVIYWMGPTPSTCLLPP